MASQKVLVDAIAAGGGREEAVYLQPPPGRDYVRTFLFSRRVDAPLARIHLLARTVFILCLSAAQLRTIDTQHPDLAGAIVLWLCGLLLFALSGMHARTARLYLLLTLPTLCSLLLTWTLLNPLPGHLVLLRQPVYSGVIHFSLSVWQLIWLAIVVGYYRWKRGILGGIVVASLIAIIVAHFIALPEWTFASARFLHPLELYVSDAGLLRAITKVIGYSAMILSTVALVVTSRDVELIGVLRQLRVPQPIIFFLGTVFRALNLALTDYETIYQAQIARAINARPRSFLRQLRDLGSIAVPMVAMMIRRSSEIGDALLARGYKLGQNMEDYYETRPLRPFDLLVLVLSLGLLYLAVGPFPGLSALLQRG